MGDVRAQITAGMLRAIAAREAQMLDTCSATRPGTAGQTPALDTDGNVVAPAAPAVYAGPCTLSDPVGTQSNARTTSEESGAPNVRVLKVPHRAALRPGDLVTLTSSVFSPGMVGDEFLVLGEDERSYATCRRYQLRGSSWLSPEAGT